MCQKYIGFKFLEFCCTNRFPTLKKKFPLVTCEVLLALFRSVLILLLLSTCPHKVRGSVTVA
jgi:hypothetical protein